MYIYSNSLPSNLLKYWMNNNVQLSHQMWKPKFCWYTTLGRQNAIMSIDNKWVWPVVSQATFMRLHGCISYIFYTMLTFDKLEHKSFLPHIYIALEAVLLNVPQLSFIIHSTATIYGSINHTKLHLQLRDHWSKLWPYIENWAKSREWALFWGCALICKTEVLNDNLWQCW